MTVKEERKRKRKDPKEDAKPNNAKEKVLKTKGKLEAPSKLRKRDGQSKHSIANAQDMVLSDKDVSDKENEEFASLDDYSGEEEESRNNRLRREAAKLYLEQLKSSVDLAGRLKIGEGSQQVEEAQVDAEQMDREIIAERLRKDVVQSKGRTFRKVADRLDAASCKMRILKGDQHHTPTCVVVSPSGEHVFAGFKSGNIIQWDTLTGKIIHTFARDQTTRGKRKGGHELKGHSSHVLCLAISFDGKYLVSGGRDHAIHVWDIQQNGQHAACFPQHRGPITGLTFQLGTHTLFSASEDRTIKIWCLSQMGYIDTLFGHQDTILAIDALNQERCLTVGARDRTARLWKVPEETQLVFRTHGDSISTCVMVDAEHFVTGSDDGTLALCTLQRKKPLATQHAAHQPGHPISALHGLRLTDVLVSGSDDGQIRFWAVDTSNSRSLLPKFTLPLPGSINGLSFDANGSLLAVAVGRDNRLGRWSVLREAKNRIVLITLPPLITEND